MTLTETFTQPTVPEVTTDGVEQYLREAAKIPLLKAAEERRLGLAIKNGQEAGRAWLKARPDNKKQLEATIHNGFDAMQALVTANLRLVISVAKKYQEYSDLTLLDLIQEGNIGLLRAARKFDASRGHKFSTYATWWIRQAITRANADKGSTIRRPIHVHEKESKLSRARNTLFIEYEREPTVQELVKATGFSIKQVEQFLQGRAHVSSLDAIRDDGDSHLAMFVPDENAVDPQEMVMQHLQRQEISEALDRLDHRERSIIARRFGLNDTGKERLEDIGASFGITRERTRQIEAEALRKLAAGKLGLLSLRDTLRARDAHQ